MSSFEEKWRDKKDLINRSNKEFEDDDKAPDDKYLGKSFVKVPSNFKYKVKSGNKEMESVKASDSTTEGNKFKSFAEIKLDRKKIEFGYDRRKKQFIMGFPKNKRSEDQRVVKESSSYNKRSFNGEKYGVNREDYLNGGAMYLKHDVRNFLEDDLKAHFNKISVDNNKQTIIDKNLPFHETDTEKDQIEEIRDMRDKGLIKNSEAQKVISDLESRISEKLRKEEDFSRYLDEVVEDSKKQIILDDDTIYFIKKKIIDETEDDGTLPNNKNNDNNNKQGETKESSEKDNISGS